MSAVYGGVATPIRQWLSGAVNFDKAEILLTICPVQDMLVLKPDVNVTQLEIVLRGNRRIQVRGLSRMSRISIGTVHSIIYSLGYHRVAALCEFHVFCLLILK